MRSSSFHTFETSSCRAFSSKCLIQFCVDRILPLMKSVQVYLSANVPRNIALFKCKASPILQNCTISCQTEQAVQFANCMQRKPSRNIYLAEKYTFLFKLCAEYVYTIAPRSLQCKDTLFSVTLQKQVQYLFCCLFDSQSFIVFKSQSSNHVV